MKSDATGSVKSQSLPDISIKLSVGSLCSQCHRPLYEEEIMSGWSTEPSCMMTECPWCRLVSVFRSFDSFRRIRKISKFQRTRPDISIEIIDRRNNSTKRFSHPFMSPMVLRKEVETLIGLGDEALMRTVQFIDNHPNQFWNLLYGQFYDFLKFFNNLKFQHSNASGWNITWTSWFHSRKFFKARIPILTRENTLSITVLHKVSFFVFFFREIVIFSDK